MTKNIKFISTIIFFGSIWGIMEASLGYVLHFLPVLISGSIMFPIASVILYRLYKVTDSSKAVFFASIVAMMFKSINLFMPNLMIWKAINPMIAILVEGFVLAFVFSFFFNKNKAVKLSTLALSSIAWRTIYIGFFIVEAAFFSVNLPLIASSSTIATFILINGAIGGATILVLHYLNGVYDQHVKVTFQKTPLLALTTFALALFISLLPFIA